MSSKESTIDRLARIHYEVEPGITQIFRINNGNGSESMPDEPVKLLEVNENTIPTGIMPLRFGPAPDNGFDHSSIIIEVTPDEFAKIRTKELALPDGWAVGDLIPRPESKD